MAAALEELCILAKTAKGASVVQLIKDATTRTNLFAFGELLDMPNVQALKGTEHAAYYELLRLFCHGTWAEYKASASLLPPLEPPQMLKLKQLTIVSLAENAKVLSYDLLMAQLDVSNVRELEDLLINDCMYTGIVRGKLDQKQRSFEVHFGVGRDIRPTQLNDMLETLKNWTTTADNLMKDIEAKVAYTVSATEQRVKEKKSIEEATEELKKGIKPEAEFRNYDMEGFDRHDRHYNMDRGEYNVPMDEDRTGGRTKRPRMLHRKNITTEYRGDDKKFE